MPNATLPFEDLSPINECYIKIPNAGTIIMNNLPDVGDSKQAVYNNIPVMGRSFPFYTYSHSGDRVITVQLHFFILKEGDAQRNLRYLRYLQSATYPRQGNDVVPYVPPVVCQLKCGELLSDTTGEPSNNLRVGRLLSATSSPDANSTDTFKPLCAILQNYNVKFPTDVAWDAKTYCPYRFDVDTSWYVVYTNDDLPNADRIVKSGR